MPKIIDYVEYTQTDDGWASRKVHDGGAFVMDRRTSEAVDADIEEIESGKRPSWSLLGLPRVLVNGEVFRERDEI